ncbi:GNAT family N-acetyltransferase [Streptomyces sp. URMC 127]|uniref:GNAT family N-acetyltransferase n=1 Tax=Streptomyces sp. URMC 127 TaxID=3423402 RepID=UPI003F1C59F2
MKPAPGNRPGNRTGEQTGERTGEQQQTGKATGSTTGPATAMTFEVRRLGPGDLGLLLGLQERVHEALPDPSVFKTSTPEFIAYCLAGGGRCYAVEHGGETVAYRMVYFPRDRDFNLAKDTSLPPSEYHRVGHWDTVAVLPGWRGHGLARLMNTRALADVARTDIRHLFATSAPANPYAVRTLLQAGFRPIGLVRKFGGRLRFLLHRPTPGAWPVTAGEQPELTVACSATEALERAFRDGWTGTGIAIDGAGGARLRMRREPLPFGTGRC